MAVLEVLFSSRNRDASDAIRIPDFTRPRISLILLRRLSRGAIHRLPDAGYIIVGGPECAGNQYPIGNRAKNRPEAPAGCCPGRGQALDSAIWIHYLALLAWLFRPAPCPFFIAPNRRIECLTPVSFACLTGGRARSYINQRTPQLDAIIPASARAAFEVAGDRAARRIHTNKGSYPRSITA